MTIYIDDLATTIAMGASYAYLCPRRRTYIRCDDEDHALRLDAEGYYVVWMAPAIEDDHFAERAEARK